MGEKLLGKIYITKDSSKILSSFAQSPQADKIFSRDEFKIDDVKEVIKEAYMAESFQKKIILEAKSFNIYAQNALLKILEEPPKNIYFIIIAPSKSIFLPTILSRLIVEVIKEKKEKIEIELDFKNLRMEDIFNFVKKNKFKSKNELNNLIFTILTKSVESGIKLNTDELESFEKSVILSSLNSKGYTILTNLLLIIYNKNKK